MIALFSKLLELSVKQRWVVVLLTLGIAGIGVYNFTRLPIDAVPDITNVQVQVNTPVEALAPLEVERQITAPIETALGGIPQVTEVRSLSRYGLSQVTVVFEDGTDIYWARQQITERLSLAKAALPAGNEPSLGPITTGLGEIYMWTVEADDDARRPDGKPYDLTDLRTIEDWIVRPQMRSVRGVAEVNAIGGFEKSFQIAPDPAQLAAYDLSFADLVTSVSRNNANAGGGYIEHKGEAYLVRATGVVTGEDDIRRVVVRSKGGVPIRLTDVADVSTGHDLRTGAASSAGHEVVLGSALMLVGENSREVSRAVGARLEEVKKSLPKGVKINSVYDRTYLVDATLGTIAKSLLEGALLVVVVLFLLLGNLRASMAAAMAIPLSMLIAITAMKLNGVSGNLMSLGAIDFGLIVDGSVIIVENCVRRFAEEQHRLGRVLSKEERFKLAYVASAEVLKASVVGVLIIGVVYVPILTLTGIEGKMFRPMAETVIFALSGATILSMTFMPAVIALTLGGKIAEKENLVLRWAKRGYERVLRGVARQRFLVVTMAVGTLAGSLALAATLGTEFSPKLSEGAYSIGVARMPSMDISTAVERDKQIEDALVKNFPDEIDHAFARAGTGEVANDPMGPNQTDMFVMLKPRDRWKRAHTQDELATKISEVLEEIPGQNYEFTQPIEMRFNELISGVRSDVAVKVFGDDLEVMRRRANDIAAVLSKIDGAEDVKVEQITGLPVLTIQIDRNAIARYGLSIDDVETVVRSAVGGQPAGQVFEGDRRFDLLIRLPDAIRRDLKALRGLPVPIGAGAGADDDQIDPSAATGARYVPLGEVASIDLAEGPNQVSREDGKRRVVVQCNVRGRDLGGFVDEAKRRIGADLEPVPGYWLSWGGQFQNLLAARNRLAVVVPIALFSIFGLLFAAFGRAKNALLIFTGVPLALTGGIVALFLRGLPISISAAIGFIALSGVAVLNGLVMVTFIENLREEGVPLEEAVHDGSLARLRPVLMTALVAALGFVPMALATGMGSEVQRPLATVVIGGIVSSTLLTLVVLPTLYSLLHRSRAEARSEPSAPAPPIARTG